jgi:malate/lactate dehydrogenase
MSQMKIGIIGAGGVGSACLLSLVMRGIACQVVMLDKNQERANGVVADLRYGATLSLEQDVRFANITIIEGTGASQLGIGMVTARIAEAILRDERAVIPVGAYNPHYGVTISLPSVLGRQGVSQILEPEMSQDERQAFQRSADILRNVPAQIAQRPGQRSA